MNQTMKLWQTLAINVFAIVLTILLTRWGQQSDKFVTKLDSKADITALEKVDKESKDRDIVLESKITDGDKEIKTAIKDLRLEMINSTQEQTRLLIDAIKKK